MRLRPWTDQLMSPTRLFGLEAWRLARSKHGNACQADQCLRLCLPSSSVTDGSWASALPDSRALSARRSGAPDGLRSASSVFRTRVSLCAHASTRRPSVVSRGRKTPASSSKAPVPQGVACCLFVGSMTSAPGSGIRPSQATTGPQGILAGVSNGRCVFLGNGHAMMRPQSSAEYVLTETREPIEPEDRLPDAHMSKAIPGNSLFRDSERLAIGPIIALHEELGLIRQGSPLRCGPSAVVGGHLRRKDGYIEAEHR